jgi:galactokinase
MYQMQLFPRAMAVADRVEHEIALFRQEVQGRARGWFDEERPIWVARAPGRLDVMGGIADYSGALVLEMPLAHAAVAGAQLRTDGLVRVWSIGPEAAALGEPRFETTVEALAQAVAGGPEAVRAFFAGHRWAGYTAGCLALLLQEGLLPELPAGVSLLLRSEVPAGAGVASSAALEVACMRALCAAYGVQLEGLALARLCQLVEHRAAGAPCGIMDQVTAELGRADSLLALRCQPHTVEGYCRVPAGYAFWGIHSGVKHSVGGSRYTRTRVATFMGRRIILDNGGELPGGYLCNLSPEEFRARWRAVLPARLTGIAFLAQYGQTGDEATRVDPAERYSVRAATAHPVYENARVEQFRRLLERAEGGDRRAMERAGRLLYASHWSYGKLCGLGARETDLLVGLLRQRGPAWGTLGAKITGGGSGGTVAVLVRHDGGPAGKPDEALALVLEAYERSTGLQPRLLMGSSDGAAHCQTVLFPSFS